MAEAHRFLHGAQDIARGVFDDPAWVTNSVTSIVDRMRADGFRPDLVVPVYDVTAPGGVLVATQMVQWFCEREQHRRQPPYSMFASIETLQDMTRSVGQVIGIPGLQANNIVIVDDVVFSGTTMAATCDRIRSFYPLADIRIAALVMHKASVFASASGVIAYVAAETNARSAKFPWGTARWYGDISHEFSLQGAQRAVVCRQRPWGTLEEFATNEECSVRLLRVRAGQRLSYQVHRKRDEFFVALDDGIALVVDGVEVHTNPGDYVLIPRNAWHRISNESQAVVRVLEIAFGEYDQIKDIERKEDDYGRVDGDGSV